MKTSISVAVLAFIAWCSCESFGAAPRFVKVSEHCYTMQLKDSGENVFAVVTEDGVLLADPPQEPELSIVVDSLKTVTLKAVRWVVFTEPDLARDAAARFFGERNPTFIADARLKALSAPKSGNKTGGSAETSSSSWFLFDRQLRLFPSNLEIRIIGLQHKARTGGDIVILVPAEKVLFVGGLYEAARYPDIDSASEGSAIEWLDGMKQVIDAVPVLKSAIPLVKPDPKSDKDKKVEESITVISSHGDASNLQNMKDLLDSARKLRNDISKAMKLGRTCDHFLASPASDPYRSYSNLTSFATQLFAELGATPPSH